MREFVRYMLLLLVGAACALIFGYSGAALFLVRMFDSASPSGLVSSGTPSSGTLSSQLLPDLTFNISPVNPLEAGFQPDERLNGLLVAIRKGNPKSLNLAREDYAVAAAANRSEYQNKILPALEREALDAMLSRFTDDDWESWPRNQNLQNGGPTAARTYVDDLTAANFTLGVFVETAARLLHGLSSKTRRGEEFFATAYLSEMIGNAELLFAKRPAPLRAEPAIRLIDQTILNNRVFTERFERERATLVRRYISQHPETITSNLALAATVDPRFARPDFFETLEKQLSYLARRVTASYRREYLVSQSKSRSLMKFERVQPGVRTASAKVFVLGAIDAVNRGDVEIADGFLAKSREIEPSLQEQATVQTLINEERNKLLAASENLDDSLASLSRSGEPQSGARLRATLADGIVSVILVAALVLVPLLLVYSMLKLRIGKKSVSQPRPPSAIRPPALEMKPTPVEQSRSPHAKVSPPPAPKKVVGLDRT